MKIIKKITLTILLLIMGAGALLVCVFNNEKRVNFSNPKVLQNVCNNKNKVEPKFKDMLPADFFGDYSNPEFWTNWEKNEKHPHNHSLSWKEPEPIDDFYKVSEYKGEGIRTWTKYTKEFNQVVIGGYEGKWKNLYFDWAKNNPKGFEYLDSQAISLKSFAGYLEDWMIWHWNKYHYNVLNRKLKNEELEFDISSFREHSVEEIEAKYKLKDLPSGNALAIGFDLGEKIMDSNDYILNFSTEIKESEHYVNDSDQTLDPYEWNTINDTVVGKVFKLRGYSLNRIFIPKSKNSIFKSFDEKTYKLNLEKYFKEKEKFNLKQFSKKSDQLIKFNLNKKFLDNKYVSEKWIDYEEQQGYYFDQNPFKKNDYKTSYKLNDKTKSISVAIKSVSNLATDGDEKINLEIKLPQKYFPKTTKENYIWIPLLIISSLMLIFLIFVFRYNKKRNKSL